GTGPRETSLAPFGRRRHEVHRVHLCVLPALHDAPAEPDEKRDGGDRLGNHLVGHGESRTGDRREYVTNNVRDVHVLDLLRPLLHKLNRAGDRDRYYLTM